MTDPIKHFPSVSVGYSRNGGSTKANALGMRPMQELSPSVIPVARPMTSHYRRIYRRAWSVGYLPSPT